MTEFYDKLFKEGISDTCLNDKAHKFLNFCDTWKAKLKDVPTPEEDACHKLAQGVLGTEPAKQDPDLSSP